MPTEARHAGLRQLVALVLYYAGVSAGYLYATLGSGSWPWPFSQAPDLHSALLRLAAYLPVLAASVAALAFVRGGGRVAKLYTGTAFDQRATLVLAACAIYTAYMLAQHRAPLAAPAVGAALLALCAMNAFAEETLYRGVFATVTANATTSNTWRRALPALAYALPHVAISTHMAAFALAFGLALGWVREGRGGLWACIACHFVADIGAIGLRFLPA